MYNYCIFIVQINNDEKLRFVFHLIPFDESISKLFLNLSFILIMDKMSRH